MGKAIAFFLVKAQSDEQAPEKRRRITANGVRVDRTPLHESVDRLAFEFNLATSDSLDPGSELPTTVSRAKVRLGDAADEEEGEPMMALVDPDLAAKAANCLAAHRAGKRAKEKSKRAREQAPSGAEVPLMAPAQKGLAHAEEKSDPREDIFAGVGTYDPTEALAQNSPALKRSRWDAGPALPTSSGDYFSDLRAVKPGEEAGGADPTVDRATLQRGIKDMAKAVDRLEERKNKQKNDPSAMDGAGSDYGQVYDYDFGGEES
mmetsp:Transcript_5877/g.13591  ORF Transcript_5877/g.13591 Transcript_5877/m.13591 type:complete len:262 (+) Transcript_5877:341-1126(+)